MVTSPHRGGRGRWLWTLPVPGPERLLPEVWDGRASSSVSHLPESRQAPLHLHIPGWDGQRHVTLWRDPWFPSGRRGQNGMGVACLGSRSGSNLRASQDPATLPDPARQPRSLVWAGRGGAGAGPGAKPPPEWPRPDSEKHGRGAPSPLAVLFPFLLLRAKV